MTALRIDVVPIEDLRARLAATEPCTPDRHGDLSVRKLIRDLSDHETSYGQCLACEAWVVRVVWFGKRECEIEDRLMTDSESARLQAIEDGYRRADQ